MWFPFNHSSFHLFNKYVFGVSLCARHRAMPLGFYSGLGGSYYGLVGETDKERGKKRKKKQYKGAK